MGFKCGIIGLPNVGKSTLFNALTKARIETANFPFSTIKPNIGVVPIPDFRLDQLAQIVRPQRVLSTTMEFVDIAGLVKGASKGKGLGNQFLTKIKEMEAIIHVVRCFDDDNIIHLAGQIDPLVDINTINTELILADLNTCENSIYRVQKKAKDGDKNAKNELEILIKCLLHLKGAKMLRTLRLSKKEKAAIRYLGFLTLKPTMYVANVSEDGFKNNHHLNAVTAFAEKEMSIIIPICATIDADLAKLNEDERHEFITEFGVTESGLNRIIRAGYQLLNLHTYFTTGIKEVRAWTIQVGTTAPQAASKIHTDLERGFIRAQTISFIDFIRYNGEQGAKEAGQMRFEGKDYIVQDGDVINFLFNI